MQYTIRNVPDALDSAIRKRVREENTSLNRALLQALARGVGLGETQLRVRDLSDLSGTWKEDPDFDRAISEQDSIDPELWN